MSSFRKRSINLQRVLVILCFLGIRLEAVLCFPGQPFSFLVLSRALEKMTEGARSVRTHAR